MMHIPALAPSPWVLRWAGLVRPAGRVLDVACGSGRHFVWFAERGFAVTGVDRDADATAPLQPLGQIFVADIEGGHWPFDGQLFDAVVVTNYLWRPRMADMVAAVAPGGVLIYETFAAGNDTVGKPSRPDFLLQPGELLRAAAGLRTVAYEDGFLDSPARFVQRIAAVRQVGAASSEPARHTLDPPAAR